MKPQLNVASDIAGINSMSVECLSAGNKPQSDIPTPSDLWNLVSNVLNVIRVAVPVSYNVSQDDGIQLYFLVVRKYLFMKQKVLKQQQKKNM